MLSSMLAKNMMHRPSPFLAASSLAARSFAYTSETQPFVFINEHTKVICQGMTGKHVSLHLAKIATSPNSAIRGKS
jgi:hypothetical protein